MKAVFPRFVCHRQGILSLAPLPARRTRRRRNCSYLPAGSLNPNTAGVFYQYDPNGNLLFQQTTSAVAGSLSTGFLEHEAATHYYWLPNEHGDILIGFDQGGNSYAVYTDHLNTPRLVTKIENPQNPRSETDTANDLPQAGYGEPQGISPLAIPVWQWSYSPFGADLANGYEARPTTLANNFKPDLWTWTGLPETGGADPNQVAQETWRIQANLTTPPTLNIRYPGQYYDFEAGLVQNWWRTYEPRMGRYVSADPIGLDGGWNRFAYVDGDGINLSDPMGLKKLPHTHPECVQRREKMGRIRLDINKRIREIASNVGKLPYYPSTPNLAARTSVQGHEYLVQDLRENLQDREKEYKERCGDDDDDKKPPASSAPLFSCDNTCKNVATSVAVGAACVAICVLQPELCIPVLAGGALTQ